jgi:ADP-dependent NAD(P)H-hydrate dehydratase / NAD(P)H-hydrate epimerase
MIPVLSREQIRAFDRHATETCGVPSLVLMENAGRGAADAIDGLLGARGRVVVVCGPGNNGGDGFVVARRLLAKGHALDVFLVADAARLRGDAAQNHAAWRGLGGAVTELSRDDDLPALERGLDGAGAVVDALLGTGLDRDVEGRLRRVIEIVNRAACLRVALDIPSGLHADTGAVLGVALRADVTVTFAQWKLGLLTSIGAEHAGRVEVADIGVPASLWRAPSVGQSAEQVEASDVARAIAPRPLAAHKASAGRVVAVAGSAGKSGAALLVAHGALRAGAGLVTVANFPDAAAALDQRVIEAMTARLDPARVEASLDEALAGAKVVAIGPGLGLDARARRVVDHVVLGWDGVKVVDADALTHFAGRAAELARAKGRLVLTPHPGEMSRLLGVGASDVERDRFASLARAVELTGAVVLLKGPRTLVGAPGELPAVNASGCPALATAGAGDVLTGIASALACNVVPRLAAISAAFIHGRAAERWAERTGADRGLLAHEIGDEVPAVLAALTSAGAALPV